MDQSLVTSPCHLGSSKQALLRGLHAEAALASAESAGPFAGGFCVEETPEKQ